MTRAPELRIVHVDTGREMRGGQQQLLFLARGLRERGHSQIIVASEGSALESVARQEGFSYIPLPVHDPARARGILQLRRSLQTGSFNLIHAHDGGGQSIAWLSSLGMPVKRVASRRVTFLPARRLDYRLKYRYTCHAVIAVSRFVKQLVVESGIPEEKVEVITDGIEVPALLPDPAARRRVQAKWGFHDDVFLAGHLGAFTPEKGQELALKAFALLSKSLPEARLVLAGSDQQSEMAKLADTCRVPTGQVRILGYQHNLEEFFPGLDLFLMPSRSEGLGSAALSAMAYGLPVVATRVGGLPEIVEENRTGWLIEPESPPALAQAVIAAASDSARRRELGLNARERAQDFCVEKMVERTESLYYRLLGTLQAAPSAPPS